MITSKHIYTYEMEEREGHIILTAQQWPWCVLQVCRPRPKTLKQLWSNVRHVKALWLLIAATVHSASCT